jgi:cytochrome d ubiquinol oxidase subunit I
VHLVATFLVAFGTTLSAFWILALNSWMQTPAGFRDHQRRVPRHELARGDLQPSFPYRLAHVLLASALTVAFLLAGVSRLAAAQGHGQRLGAEGAAHRADAGRAADPAADPGGRPARPEHAAAPAAKVAAMEGIWQTERGAPLLLFACPTKPRAATTSRSASPSWPA